MATPGHLLVLDSRQNALELLRQLEAAKTTASRIVQRMEALGVTALEGYEWPNEYTQADFVALYNALDDLPGSVVADDVRDKLYKLVAAVQ